MSDERDRLRRLDPAPADLDPVESPRARELLERVMSDTDLSTPSTSRTKRALAVAAGVAALAAAGGLALAARDGGAASERTTRTALSLQAGDAMASCIPFDVKFLKDMTPAFAGTVTSVDGDTVVLDVTKVYAGQVGDEVVLTQPGGSSSAALDGVAFEEGKDYLVTAAQGVVNGCGYSGAATAELRASFEQAFPG
jgi:hypothetical protein